jgi:hypothetical protein
MWMTSSSSAPCHDHPSSTHSIHLPSANDWVLQATGPGVAHVNSGYHRRNEVPTESRPVTGRMGDGA